MNIVPPVPGTTPGPEWASDINDILTTTIAEHNHVGPNGGVALTQDALAISDDLSLNGNALTSVEKVVLATQGSVVASTASVYNLSGNLYYKNGSGLNIQITDATGLAANSVDGISGLAASDGGASYSAGTFSWTATNGTQYALSEMGAINLYNYTQINPTYKTVISQPNILVANKVFQLGTTNIYFPTSLPAVPTALEITSIGALNAFVPATDSDTIAGASFTGVDTLLASLSLPIISGRQIEVSLQPRTGNFGGMNLLCKNLTAALGTNAPCTIQIWAIVNSNTAKRGKITYRLYDPIVDTNVAGGVQVNPAFTWLYTPDAGDISGGVVIDLYAVSSDGTNFTTSLNNFTFIAREI
jgi:hypothetical protein